MKKGSIFFPIHFIYFFTGAYTIDPKCARIESKNNMHRNASERGNPFLLRNKEYM